MDSRPFGKAFHVDDPMAADHHVTKIELALGQGNNFTALRTDNLCQTMGAYLSTSAPLGAHMAARQH